MKLIVFLDYEKILKGILNFDKSNFNPNSISFPHRLFNFGNSQFIKLIAFIRTIETALGVKVEKIFLSLTTWRFRLNS